MNSSTALGFGGSWKKVTLTAAATGVQGSWLNNTGKTCLVAAVIDVTTVATGAATLDTGVATTAVTNDGLLDGTDVNTAIGQFSSGTGTNGRIYRKLATGSYVTVFRATGDPTGMVADLYIHVIEID